MFQYILFDLDGTLTDPMVGITSSVQYALKSFGIEEPDLNNLTPFIGPPLIDSLMEFYDFTEENAKLAVEKYRERFSTIGLYENEIYPGIADMLRKLVAAGAHLAVASSKPTVFVEKILIHFAIRSYFEVVVGSELDGRRTDKAEVVDEALRQLGMTDEKKQYCAMVGDRRFDIEGAKAHGVTAVGVAYGYAEAGELEQAGADFIAGTVGELAEYLSKQTHIESKQLTSVPPSKDFSLWQSIFPRTHSTLPPEHTSFTRAFSIVAPVMIYYVVNNLLVIGMAYLVQWLSVQSGGLQELSVFLAAHSMTFSTVIRMLGMVLGALAVLPAFWMEKPIIFSGKIGKIELSLLAILGITAALFVNVAFSLLHVTGSSDAYQEVAQSQFSLPLFWGIILYGIISPVAEEIVFRGVVYNRMRRQFPYAVAVLASAILFGVFHGNLVQGAYGFVLGLLIIWTYERYGSFFIPVLIHAVANSSVYLVMENEPLRMAVMSLPGMVLLGIISISSVCLLVKQYGKIN